jgi:dephospho-CoA kinase
MGRFYPGLITIGITGTIGSGKSSVGKILQDLGVPVIDSDEIVHSLLATDQCTQHLVVQRFGTEVLLNETTGKSQIDRKALGRIVFNDPASKADLEKIIHPRVRELSRSMLDHYAEDASVTLVASLIPLLFEAKLGGEYDQIWAVTTDDAILRERLRMRDHFSEAELEKRLASQWPQERKAALADKVIDNSGDLLATRKQVSVFINQLTGKDSVDQSTCPP